MAECKLPPQGPGLDAAPRRILVADDEHMVRELLSRFLTERGHQVVQAADGFEALEKIKSEPFDLLLSDVRMPGMDGIKLLKAVKDISPRMPVVLISGYGEVETVVSALKAGAENFLAKPLRLEGLERVVEQSLSLACIRPAQTPGLPKVEQETRIVAPSVPEYVCEVVYQVALSAVAVGFAHPDLDNNIKLALAEAVTNAMEHGNRWDQSKLVETVSRVSREVLEVVVTDQGEGFDHKSLGDPTHEDNLLCERGRGVFLMRAIMDQVIFEPPGNRVTMVKYKKEPDQEQ